MRMLKSKVTIESGSGARSYEGDYVFVATANVGESVECRWFQEPADWEKGLGPMLVGIEALKIVAEQPGDAKAQLAARAALDAMKAFEPKEAQ
jgi:hypothetical protein